MSKKILLADDSVTIQKVVSITFTSEDFDLSTVSDGASAISKAREIKPDLILLDISMPQKNGYQVCEEIRHDPDLKDIPVLMLAGTFEPYDEEEGRKVGADDHIVKPFESQELIDKVKTLLDKQGTAKPAEAEAVSEKRDVWDVADISDFLEVEKEAMTTEEEGVGEAIGFSKEEVEEPYGEVSFGEVSKEEVKETIPEEEKEEEEEVMIPEGSIEEIAEHPEEGIEETLLSFEEENIEDEPDKGVGSGDEELELIEEIETLEEIEPIGTEEDKPLEETAEKSLSVQTEGEEPVHKDMEEDAFFFSEKEVEETTHEDTSEGEIEFEEIISEEIGAEEKEAAEETMLTDEIGSEVVTGQEEKEEKEEEGNIAIEEAAPEPEKVVPEDVLLEENTTELPGIDEVLEETVKERVRDSLTHEKIEEVLNRVVKEVIEEVTWEVAPGLIEDIIKAEVTKVKNALAKVKEAFNGE